MPPRERRADQADVGVRRAEDAPQCGLGGRPDGRRRRARERGAHVPLDRRHASLLPRSLQSLSTLCPEMNKHPLRDWETSERLLESGGFESGSGCSWPEPAVEASDAGARWLGVTYWQAVDRLHPRRRPGDLERRRRPAAAARRRQPAHVRPAGAAVDGDSVSCRYPIEGGLLALRPGGSVTLAQRAVDGELRAQRHRRGVPAAARGDGPARRGGRAPSTRRARARSTPP